MTHATLAITTFSWLSVKVGLQEKRPRIERWRHIHMAGHQINLTEQYNRESLDPSQSHLFTKSTHNQKIECLWSQLMKQFNIELINKLYHAAKEKYYNPEDPLQQLVFLYLWVPLLQKALDDWTSNYNSYKRRFDKKSTLPTQCSADWAYKYPEDRAGEHGLIPVPLSAVEVLQNAFYPEGSHLMRTSPQWFCERPGLLATEFESVSDSLGGARPSLNRMAASNKNSDAAIRARFSGSELAIQLDGRASHQTMQLDGWQHAAQSLYPPSSSIT
ncbi:hypothetical protein PCANC_15094 [Puccinia coronata f. sp. avenae]|uniref:Integrase core domain-containing protein n=1 Tax=Puccinia coronata f. sp. avenae TaxID=200324 RepID=A0A2N5UBF8_9BASI|nr:hypothetical protein PCANC_15124 [Puccinia coronata f. sp. avenae]PLW35073.1 hypothetical protein PCANC_15094 [Puccinia coronata f. sp. avenae]